MTGGTTLFDFGGSPAPGPQEEAVPVLPIPIRNFALVRQKLAEAFGGQHPERVRLVLVSNGSMDRPATEWYLRRCVN